MDTAHFSFHHLIVILLLVSLSNCETGSSKRTESTESSISKEEMANQAWQMEERYWDYVQKNDTVVYKELWHDQFIGYPSFGNGVSNKDKIAIWIPELHQDSSLAFSYKLYKKAVNVIEGVVIVFYDADEIWTDKENNVVKKVTLKVTHTWRKDNDRWLILGGMAANKNSTSF